MDPFPDFRDLLTLFNAHRVEYVVVGGYAVAHHGAPRYTGDIDICIRPTAENAARILAALDAFGFGGVGLDASDFTRPNRVVQLGFPPCRIDLMTSLDGLTTDEAFGDTSAGMYGDAPVAYLGLEALRRNKRATGRAKDLADLEALGTPGA